MPEERARIAAVQLSPNRTSPKQTVEQATQLVADAAKKGAGVICLPEHWLLDNRADASQHYETFSRLASGLGVFLIPGANFVGSGDLKHVECVLINPSGEIVGRQYKTHLFRAEKQHGQPGSEYAVYDAGKLRIGLVVCYDNVFPEVPRILAVKGADVLFVPSRIVSEGWEPWVLYLRTRAMENRVACVGPNIFLPPRFGGRSVIVGLDLVGEAEVVYPTILAEAKDGPGVILADVDIERMRTLRQARFSERRPELYRDLTS